MPTKPTFTPYCVTPGLGKVLLQFVMAQAQQAGYQVLYLETVHWMKEAIGAYGRLGFEPIPTHCGNTGHQHKMSVFMQRPLV
jgi:putative acetyltransferase